MPGFDGTGPRGEGPMTGGGKGYCAVPASGIARPVGRFAGRGGRGRRNQYYATGLTGWQRAAMGYQAFGQVPAGFDETEMLKNQAELLKAELEDIQKRLALLEKK